VGPCCRSGSGHVPCSFMMFGWPGWIEHSSQTPPETRLPHRFHGELAPVARRDAQVGDVKQHVPRDGTAARCTQGAGARAARTFWESTRRLPVADLELARPHPISSRSWTGLVDGLARDGGHLGAWPASNQRLHGRVGVDAMEAGRKIACRCGRDPQSFVPEPGSVSLVGPSSRKTHVINTDCQLTNPRRSPTRANDHSARWPAPAER